MGIPSLFYYYYNKYNCENELMLDIEKLRLLRTNHLFFDFNSLIHPCAQQILSANNDTYLLIANIDARTHLIEREIIQHCLAYTRLLISEVMNADQHIKKTVHITIDGVAPRSKMNQQRERRYKSEFFKHDKTDGKSCLWDSNKITPGTSFMMNLKLALIEFLQVIQDELQVTCVISDSSEIGEGEHKIMRVISSLGVDEKVIIYGLDADLIMLSLMNTNYRNIVLIRDNSFNSQLSDEKQVIDYLDINNLRTYICKDLLTIFWDLKKVDNSSFDLQSLVIDYVLICFFLGNDFLDHLPSITIKKHGIEIIMKAYVNAWKGHHLVDSTRCKDAKLWKTSIDVVYLKDVMFQLKNHETYFFKNYRVDTLCAIDLALSVDLELNQTEKVSFYKQDLIEFHRPDYKRRYYLYYDMSDLDQVCFNYIEGLYWVLGYYNNHIHDNWSWFYRFHNAPFCSDLFDFLRKADISYHIGNSKNLISSKAFSSTKQLFMVLPESSLSSILQELRDKDFVGSTLLKAPEYFPKKLYIDAFNKRYLWQTKIFFDDLDDQVIDAFID